jgi:hypothetical protein
LQVKLREVLMRSRRTPWKAALCGLVGGAAGTLVMEGYWKALVALAGHDPRQSRKKNPPKSANLSVLGHPMREGEESTETVGRLAYRTVTGRSPETMRTREALSQTVHWTYGTAQGGIYGAALGSRRTETPNLAGGAAFGTALWAVSEVVLPVLGLGKGPTAYTAAHHAATWGAHVVYGLTAAAVTQALARLT